jgi:omega-amidase
MKISVIQPDIFWEDKASNINNLSDLLSPLFNKTDIVILPEMFNTGFSMNTEQLCEPTEGETLNWMRDIAGKGNFGICGSLIIKEHGKYYNRWLFVSPGSEYWQYDKRHPFSMAGENKLFSAGKSRLVFTFRGVRISAYICYDLRFPVWSRNTDKSDLIIYAANWPESRRNVWDTLLKARAIENQCFVAGSNRTGTDGMGIAYCGESMIISPRGEIIASAGIINNSYVSAEISLTELEAFRSKFPVLNDADKFILDT